MQSCHVFRHYKGRYYRVLYNNAAHSESGELLIVYQQLQHYSAEHPAGRIWVRPASLFYDASPADAHKRRFEPVKRVPRRIAKLVARLDRLSTRAHTDRH